MFYFDLFTLYLFLGFGGTAAIISNNKILVGYGIKLVGLVCMAYFYNGFIGDHRPVTCFLD